MNTIRRKRRLNPKMTAFWIRNIPPTYYIFDVCKFLQAKTNSSLRMIWYDMIKMQGVGPRNLRERDEELHVIWAHFIHIHNTQRSKRIEDKNGKTDVKKTFPSPNVWRKAWFSGFPITFIPYIYAYPIFSCIVNMHGSYSFPIFHIC